MPAYFSHLIIAEQVTKNLFSKSQIEYKNAFFYGAILPDLAFTVKPYKSKNYGRYIHSLSIENCYNRLLNANLTTAEQVTACGFLSHIIADAIFHPFIYDKCEKLKSVAQNDRKKDKLHFEIERSLDRLLLDIYGAPTVKTANQSPFGAKILTTITGEKIKKYSLTCSHALGVFPQNFLKKDAFLLKPKIQTAERFLHLPHFFSCMFLPKTDAFLKEEKDHLLSLFFESVTTASKIINDFLQGATLNKIDFTYLNANGKNTINLQ